MNKKNLLPETRTVREDFKCLLEAPKLSNSELDSLHQLRRTGRQLQRFWRYSTAAVFLILFASSHYMMWIHHQSQIIENSLVREVMTNHINIKPLDFHMRSIRDLQQQDTLLDFKPVVHLSERIKAIGGRYCTLQGAIALQIRLKNSDGEDVTYFQSRYQKSRFGSLPDIDLGQNPRIIYDQGMKLQLWQEKGVANVLVQPT